MQVATRLGEVSRHKCLIYDGDPSEQLPIVVPLLAEGLRDNWRCLYLGDLPTVRIVDTALAARGINTRREAERGALVLSSERTHLVDGKFDPQAMVVGLASAIDGAVHDGFQGLCATGDMKWELGDDENFKRLLEYEALLEQVFERKPLMGICQYHRSLVPAEAVRDALLTHRSTYVGDAFNQDNLFYIPPDLLLEAKGRLDGGKYGDWMCQQILRVMDAERERDKVMQALRDSEAQQRRLAEQLAEANRDLERRVSERTTELAEANRNLAAFSYSVSHDLRAPLRAIRGFGQVLLEEFSASLPAEGRQHLDRMVAGAAQMNVLIERMLDLGRATGGELRVASINFSALAEEVIQQVRTVNADRKVEAVVASGMRAAADPALLRTVLANLIENAWKFTGRVEHARVEVGSAGVQDGKTVFFVRDNGAGFDMQYAQRLFGVFQRLHRQEEFPGTGVGLATTARIIAKHGGRIWAESQPNQGAAFFFTLPT